MQKTILIFESRDGKSHFTDWLMGLKDIRARAVVRARIERVRLGNLGDCKSVGEGVSELKISFGPGYRVYLGQDGPVIVVLLCGGDKSSQKRDIAKAKLLWTEYKNERKKLSR